MKRVLCLVLVWLRVVLCSARNEEFSFFVISVDNPRGKSVGHIVVIMENVYCNE